MGATQMFSRIFMAAAAIFAMAASSHARSVTLDGRVPTIRLCPVQCISVSGHGFSAGAAVKVLETRGGWARLSPVLDAQKLKQSFGERVPENPAYWVKLTRTSGLQIEQKASQTKTEAKPKKIATRQQRRVTLPKVRPGTIVTSLARAERSTFFSGLTYNSAKTSQPVLAAMYVAETTTTARFGDDDEFEAAVKAEKQAALEISPEQPTQPLTDDKMAKWIAANRGEVLKDVGAETAEAVKTLANGKELENRIVALKTSVDPATGFGAVPEVMTVDLLDKRLNILPGMNSNIPEETVIALRHYALGLLNSGTCKGIAGGGAGDAADTVYLVCTDDLTKTLEFPLKQSG